MNLDSENEAVAEAVKRLHYDGVVEDADDLETLRAVGFTRAYMAPIARTISSVKTGDHLRDSLPERLELHRIAHNGPGAFWAPTWARAFANAMQKFAPSWELALDRDDPRILAVVTTTGGAVVEYILHPDDLPIEPFDPSQRIGSRTASAEADST